MIYLASQSPRRSDLLKEAGLAFKRVKVSFKERTHFNMSPEENAVWDAVGKSTRVSAKKEGVVLTADTLVALKGKILGKPKSRKEAKAMLSSLSGHTHEVITGVALRSTHEKLCKAFYVKSQVTFKKLSPDTINTYLDCGEYRDKAGAYGFQGEGRKLIRQVRGSRTNVIGLPMKELKKALSHFSG